MTCDSATLKGLRALLFNPAIRPADLRGETHLDDKWKSERAMNFGLLVVASHLAKLGAEVRVLDLEEEKADVAEEIGRFTPHVVGIGNISCYSILSTLDIIAACRESAPEVKVMVGGQNASVSLAFFANAPVQPDWLVLGPGEIAARHICEAVFAGRAPEPLPSVVAFPLNEAPPPMEPGRQLPLAESAYLLYDLYPNWRRHFPLVEESRGCPFACEFCANLVEEIGGRRFQAKPPELIVRELDRAAQLWGVDGELPGVLMCANYGTRPGDTEVLLRALRRSDRRYRLLAAMRVDVNWEGYVGLMEGLFDQIHFGLESASPDILRRMNKTNRPSRYLEKASRAFKAFKKARIHVACNFILGFPGETGRTLMETMSFLMAHQPWIDSLWGGPLIEYPGSPFAARMDSYAREFGTQRRRVSDYCDQLGVWPIDPSHSLSHEHVAQASMLLMKMFNRRRGFYEHYRWYPGPQPKLGAPLAFYDEDIFFGLFLKGKEPTHYGFDPTS